MKITLRFALVALTTSAFSFTALSPALSAESTVKSMRGIDTQASDQAPEEKFNPGKRPGSQNRYPHFRTTASVIPHAGKL
jgi:hypothetical protein